MNHSVPVQDKTAKQLKQLRNKRGAGFHAHRAFQQKKADAQDPADQEAWFRSMHTVFEEIDDTFHFLDPATPQRFLDLGCCPGGFASYILSRYPKTSGVGISLPVEHGGHGFLLEDYLQPRFELIWGDFTKYQLGPMVMDDPSLEMLPPIVGQPLPLPFSDESGFGPEKFDVILVDGHPLRGAESELALGLKPAADPAIKQAQTAEFYTMGDHIFISQLIIALQAVLNSLSIPAGPSSTSTRTGPGPTVVMKLSKPERLVTAQIMYMFDVLSASVGTWKPVHMHATRSTFYLVAMGVGRSPRFLPPSQRTASTGSAHGMAPSTAVGPIRQDSTPNSPEFIPSPLSSPPPPSSSRDFPPVLGMQAIRHYLDSLRCLWYSLKYGGSSSSPQSRMGSPPSGMASSPSRMASPPSKVGSHPHLGFPRRLQPGDLDFIVTEDIIVGEYRPRLEQLARHVWEVEKASLRGWHKTEGFA